MIVVTRENARENMRPTQTELEDEIATLSAHIYAGTCRWLELIAELDRRADWCGACTTAQWHAWRCALSQRAAREHVRVARALGELPRVREAFSRGELSYAKVRALTRVATPKSEEDLLELAGSLTAAQLDRAVACYRRVSAAEANNLQATAYFGYRWDEDGALFFQGRLAPEDGALLLRALEAGRDALRERENEWDEERRERIERGPAGPHEPRYRPSNADAVVAMAGAALSSAAGEHSNAERYQVVVHLEAESPPALEGGPSIATETVERVSCDSSLLRIVERDGEALSIGRKTRVVPSAVRRALRARDGGCRFPGCDNRRFVDAHHIHHWARGGETSVDNLVLLCRRHHQLVHEGGYALERLGDGDLLFRYPWGGPIASVPRSPPGSAAELARDRGIGPWTCEGGDGDRIDLDLTVAVLQQALR
jgi:hypothetical protein